jgi:hypothetical protein
MSGRGAWRRAAPTTVGMLIALAICLATSFALALTLEFEVSNATGFVRGIAFIAALALALIGVIVWLVRWGPPWRDSPRLAPLWATLEGRPGLLIGYGLILVTWAALCQQLSVEYWPELLANAFSNSGSFIGFIQTRENRAIVNALLAVAFVLTQAAFLWGGGTLRLGASVPKPYRLAISMAIFTTVMSLLTLGLLAAVLESVDRLDTSGRGEPTEFGDVFGVLIFASWTLWLPIAWFAMRGVDQPTGLSRLAGVMLAGSWIEVAVALPIELVKRGRHEDCPCSSGSWLALVFAGPLLLWSIGPAVYLLYLRERALDGLRPGHARRLLARKSARVKPAPEVQA